jgi:hypothetical protein
MIGVFRKPMQIMFLKERLMAKPNFQFQKRQKELEKKKKNEEKLERKRAKSSEQPEENPDQSPDVTEA